MDTNARWEVQFYQTRRGESPIDDFLDGLTAAERAKCVLFMIALEDSAGRLPFPYARKVSASVWELRPEYRGNAFRFFYFTLVAGKVIVVHAVRKKSQKLKPRDVNLAASRGDEVRRRLEERHDGRFGIQDASPIRRRADGG